LARASPSSAPPPPAAETPRGVAGGAFARARWGTRTGLSAHAAQPFFEVAAAAKEPPLLLVRAFWIIDVLVLLCSAR